MIKAPASTGPMTAKSVATRGLWHENPVLVQTLGLCSALAVTNAVSNSLAMGLATTFVLVGSSLVVSTLRRIIAYEIRITAYILIIATFLAIADMALEATVPNVHKAMGPYIALIITNCIVLGRAEGFAMSHGVRESFLDGVGNGVGYALVLACVGAARELGGSGTLLGVSLLPLREHGGWYEPMGLLLLPPSAFFLLAGLVWAVRSWRPAQVEAAEPLPAAAQPAAGRG